MTVYMPFYVYMYTSTVYIQANYDIQSVRYRFSSSSDEQFLNLVVVIWSLFGKENFPTKARQNLCQRFKRRGCSRI